MPSHADMTKRTKTSNLVIRTHALDHAHSCTRPKTESYEYHKRARIWHLKDLKDTRGEFDYSRLFVVLSVSLVVDR